MGTGKEKADVGLWMKKVPVPMVGKNDVKIKIHKTAICGTDVHIYNWNDGHSTRFPVGLTAGHEYVGEICRGWKRNVEGFKGRRSGIRRGFISSVENAVTVLAGMKHLCKNTQGVGVNRNGAFAEYLEFRQQMHGIAIPPSVRSSTPSLIPWEMRFIQHFSFDMVGEMS